MGRGLAPSLFLLLCLFLLPKGTEDAEVSLKSLEELIYEMKGDHTERAFVFIEENCKGTHCEVVKECIRNLSEEIDPLILSAMIYVESAFKPYAVSHKGAIGVMQVMPEAGKEIALSIGLPFYESLLFDVKYNIMIGTHYLMKLLKMFKGDLRIALLAYNFGPTYVTEKMRNKEWLPRKYFPKIRKVIEEEMSE